MVFPAKAFVFAEIHERTNERLRDAPRKSGAGRLHKKNGNALKSSAGSWTHAMINSSKAQPLALGFTSKFRGRNQCSPPHVFTEKQQVSPSVHAHRIVRRRGYHCRSCRSYCPGRTQGDGKWAKGNMPQQHARSFGRATPIHRGQQQYVSGLGLGLQRA
jgi:hypothetical protein